MSQFVELTDYDASIHRDILDALVREALRSVKTGPLPKCDVTCPNDMTATKFFRQQEQAGMNLYL